MKRYFIGALFIVIALFCFAKDTDNYYDFTDSLQNEGLRLKNYSGRFAPKIYEAGYLQLLNGGYGKNHHNAVIFPDTISATAEIEHFYFNLYITRGAEGAGFALLPILPLNEGSMGWFVDDKWEGLPSNWSSPNMHHAFAVGIDIYNPPTSHWFDEFGNVYGREEREISLHWDNKEIYKILSPIEFRSSADADSFHRFDIILKYSIAGAYVNVAIDSIVIINDYFIPELTQYKKQPIFGASTSELTCSVILDDFGYKTSGRAPDFQRLISVNLLTDEVFHAERRELEKKITFPKSTSRADKIIMTLDLGGAEGGVSAWDVSGYIYLINSDSTRYEILRFITPYNRSYIWKVDVTDYLPLFIDTKTVYATVHTWEPVTDNPAEQKGWKVSAKLDFYRENESNVSISSDKPRLSPFHIENLWNGSFEYGDSQNPLINQLPDLQVVIPQGTKSAKLRITTTGHGMSPNTDNAAEFRPADRWIGINGDEYYNLLWKTDNYLNPCRPQDGTWKFDRAGWAPGDIVRPWEIDLTKYIKDGVLNLSYIPDDYINVNKGETWEPFHSIATQIIFYE